MTMRIPMKTRQFTTALFSALLLGLGLGIAPLQFAHAADNTLRVGIMSGEDEDVWKVVAANAAKHGLAIKVTTFSDYTQPNEALSSHDLDAAVVNTDWAVKSGIRIPDERIAQEKVPGNPYRNFIAVNEKDAKAPWVQALVESYQQPNVAAEIQSVYHGATLPAWNGPAH
jgi:ABC-type metal ion transport system substrate-binding protein